MKTAVMYAAVGLGSVSVVGVGYAIKTVLGLGGNFTGLSFSQNALDSPRSVPEPETFLLLGTGLLALALWRHRSIGSRLFR